MTSKISRVYPDAEEFKKVLARSLNCLPPDKIPQWALDLSDEVLPTDKIEIRVVRETPEAPSAG